MAKWLHLETVTVKAGQVVKPGTKIGTIGNTGRSTAAHLHYQLDKGKRNIDPVKYHGTLRRQLPERSITPFLQSIGPVIDRLENGPESPVSSLFEEQSPSVQSWSQNTVAGDLRSIARASEARDPESWHGDRVLHRLA